MREQEISTDTERGIFGMEWRMLQSFRSHRNRLNYKLQYQPLEAALQGIPQTMLKNALEFFDTGIRQIFMRCDQDNLATSGLDLGTQKAQMHLRSLCTLLDRLVNIDLVSSDSLPLQQQSQGNRYQKLNALLNVLATYDWPFDLVMGQGRKLFQLESESAAMEASELVDKFNDFFTPSRLSLNDILPTQPAAAQTSRLKGNEFRDRAVTALATLLAKLQDCPVGHKVLVKLPDWDNIEPNTTDLSLALDLFLSTCPDSSKWQESQCDVQSPRGEADWQEIEKNDRFCQEIQDALVLKHGLGLAVVDEKIYVFDAGNGSTQERSHPGHQPALTLHELLATNNFVENWSPAMWPTNRPKHRFDSKQKRSLAAKLALSLSIYLGSRHTLSSWDSKQIYFLAGVEGRCVRELPYALCIIDANGSDTKAVKDVLLDQLTSVFATLAKLLLEIEYGCLLDDISIDQLKKRVEGGLEWESEQGDEPRVEQMKDIRRIDYLYAVQTLLNFDIAYRKRSRRLTGRGLDFFTIARMVIYTEIAEQIQKTIRPIEPKNIPLRSGELNYSHDPVTQPSNLYPIHWPITTAVQWRPERLPHRERHQETQTAVIELFDEIDEISYDKERASKADFFFKQLEKFHNSCELHAKVLSGSTFLPATPVRIAILDTGIDKSHGSIVGGFLLQRLRKERCYSWVGGDSTDVHDSHGHGTNATDLLLRVAPQAQIYVAKVFSGNEFNVEEASNVAKAIIKAVNEWKVDIITMSFGLKSPAPDDTDLINAFKDIEDAIKKASSKILFAAAANHGSHGPRSFPADCRDVICIHASDGKGKDGRISPRAKEDDDNFMTLGIAIPVTDAQGVRRLKSGTSYATPIAAAMAAHVLYVTECMMGLTPTARKRLRTSDGMRKMLDLMSDQKDQDGYRFVAPWVKFWTEDWHRNPHAIGYVRENILKTQMFQF